MSARKITAIIRSEQLQPVEERLQSEGVHGISVSIVKGYGEYANFFTHDWMVRHTKVEIFASAAETPRIVRAILAAARTGAPGDGIVAVQPAEYVLHIRSGQALAADRGGRGPDSATSGSDAFGETGSVEGTDSLLPFAVFGSSEAEPMRPPNDGLLGTALRYSVSILTVLALLAAVLMAARHKLHFLCGAFAAVLALYVLVGLVTYVRNGGRRSSRPDDPDTTSKTAAAPPAHDHAETPS